MSPRPITSTSTALRRNRRSLAVVLSAGVLAVTLAGCGSSDHDMGTMPAGASMPPSAGASGPAVGPAAPGPHNDADVAFATGMIPHHAQAVQMAAMATQRSASSEVKKLAAEIKAAQQPEITQLSGWLTGWGKPVPATDGTMAMDHGSGGHGGMVGMMTEQEMTQLGAATGAAFDTMWLQMMIKHHEGAVAMAKTQLAEGSNDATKQLAQTVATTQTAEIAVMRTLGASLS